MIVGRRRDCASRTLSSIIAYLWQTVQLKSYETIRTEQQKKDVCPRSASPVVLLALSSPCSPLMFVSKFDEPDATQNECFNLV